MQLVVPRNAEAVDRTKRRAGLDQRTISLHAISYRSGRQRSRRSPYPRMTRGRPDQSAARARDRSGGLDLPLLGTCSPVSRTCHWCVQETTSAEWLIGEPGQRRSWINPNIAGRARDVRSNVRRNEPPEGFRVRLDRPPKRQDGYRASAAGTVSVCQPSSAAHNGRDSTADYAADAKPITIRSVPR
jgi:hypothetical protein